MPDNIGPASEFGGKVQKNRIQPLPHTPDPSERLMLLYTTGDESGISMPDNDEAFSGLLPYEEQYAKRAAEGAFDKGQVYKGFLTDAEIAQQELAGSGGEIVA